MKIITVNPTFIISRIIEFYTNAKEKAHQHSYGWDEVFNDIDLAQSDTNFKPYNSSKRDWIMAGYNVVINERGWAFAYRMDNSVNLEDSEVMMIYDVDNYRNLDVHIESTKNLSLYQNLSSVKPARQKKYTPIGYGWWAIRQNDGYLYIKHKKGNIMQGVRFNQILRPFRKRRDDANIYAVGQYGEKKFKLYLNGKHIMLENRRIIRMSESQFMDIITECITNYLKEIA